jgi:3-oxoacid CoA-transferase subunit B
VTYLDSIKDGTFKILHKCTLPLTGIDCVKLVVTDLASCDWKGGGFHLIQRAPGVSVDEIKRLTQAELIIPKDVPEMTFN